ncbi:MAG: DUF4837 family protein [Prevotellaceae bacterium]|jgi:hypothetical protein|nr:DUF4837 family protein [Prevotellaceae bacterium]
MKRFIRSIIWTVSLSVAVSCGGGGGDYLKPGATGKIGELLVIIDNAHWDSELGETIRSIFQKPYPKLPQIESSFTLLPLANSSFLPIMQRHRNILLVKASGDFPEAKLTISRDLWAKPQIVLHAVGPDIHSVAKVLSEKQDIMMKLYEQAELDRQSESARIYSDPEIHKAIEARFGISLDVTTGRSYHIMRNDPDFMWLESQSNRNSLGIFIYTYPYVDSSTFTVRYLVNKRDSILKEKVHGSRDSSWMTTTTNLTQELEYLMPELEIKKFRGLVYGELRGLWDLVNDYLAGPFVSRSYIDTAKNRIITVEGYVWAAGFSKRNLVREILGIINTFSVGGSKEFDTKEQSERLDSINIT